MKTKEVIDNLKEQGQRLLLWQKRMFRETEELKTSIRFAVVADLTLLNGNTLSDFDKMMYTVTIEDNVAAVGINDPIHTWFFETFEEACKCAKKFKAKSGSGPIKWYVVTETEFLETMIEINQSQQYSMKFFTGKRKVKLV